MSYAKSTEGRFLFTVPSQGSSVLNQLDDMRSSQVLVDVIIKTERREFPSHRVVLAASSQYFKAMFSYGLKECHELVVPIHGVSSEIMQTIVDYAYTGRCLLTRHNAAEIMMTADLFQMLPLKDAAVKFLSKCLDVENCLSIRKVAENHSCNQLLSSATKYTRIYFKDIVSQEDFLELDVKDLISYLSDDELTVNKEDVVFDAAMKWIRHKEDRHVYMPHVLEAVRLPFVSPEYLKSRVAEEPLIQSSGNCIRQVEQARKFQASGHFLDSCESAQRRPRRCASKEVLIVFGGESRVGNFHECVHDVSYYDPDTKKWSTLALVPGTLHTQAFGAVSLGYDIYITGGAVNNAAVKDVRIFYTYLNKWCNEAPMLQARYHHATVVVNNQVYAVGGTDGVHCLDSVERYSASENKWMATEPLIHAVKCPAVAAYENKLYVFGGFTEEYTITQSIQVYDPGRGKWIVLSCPDVDYTCAQAVYLNHKIYLLGGCSKTVKVYDPETDTVVKVADMSTVRARRQQIWNYSGFSGSLQKRDNCGATAVGGKIYVTGGVSESNGSALDSVECYCPVLDKWENIVSMPTRLYRHGSVSIRIPVYRKESAHRKKTNRDHCKQRVDEDIASQRTYD